MAVSLPSTGSFQPQLPLRLPEGLSAQKPQSDPAHMGKMEAPSGMKPEIGPSEGLGEAQGVAPGPSLQGPSFSDRVAEFVDKVNGAQLSAEKMGTDFAEGRQNDLHGTMIEMQRADVLLRLGANVRNRAIEAYREVMRMGA